MNFLSQHSGYWRARTKSLENSLWNRFEWIKKNKNYICKIVNLYITFFFYLFIILIKFKVNHCKSHKSLATATKEARKTIRGNIYIDIQENNIHKINHHVLKDSPAERVCEGEAQQIYKPQPRYQPLIHIVWHQTTIQVPCTIEQKPAQKDLIY